MTFATLRALHAIIGDAITDIERVYAENSGAHPREQSPTPAPSPTPITPSTPYYPMDTPDDDIRRHHILYAPKEETIEDLLESNCREDVISFEGASGLGLGAPFSPKGTKKSSQAKVQVIPSQDRLRTTFNSPPPSPMSPDTPSPATPASSRRTLRTWQSMAALSPRRSRTRRDSFHEQSTTAPTMYGHRDTATPPASHSHTPRRHALHTLELPPPKFLHSPSSSSSNPPTPSSEYLAFRTPPTPSLLYQPHLEFPSLDAPYDQSSPAEILNASHPVIATSIARVVAASGQLAAMVQTPFLTICDAVMQYHLPACMRLFEASHVPEILREAGPDGLHVEKIAERNGVDASKLAHVLRLLATHHILREAQPDVFALNRISSVVDTGKDASWLLGENKRAPPASVDGGTPTFTRDKMPTSNQDYDERVKCTDELFKAASYMTEAYYLSDKTKHSREPVHTPFNFAFNTRAGFFGWLEGEESGPPLDTDGLGAELVPDPKTAFMVNSRRAVENRVQDDQAFRRSLPSPREKTAEKDVTQSNRFRLERFGKAMVGTASWEAPYAILHGFDWASLPPGSTIVDVGGGIGSTSMLLANEFASRREGGIDLVLKFVIQDRPVVVKMGEKAWRDQRPELLDCGTARFQVHDFFSPQPIKNAAIFLLRAVLHDWPDKFARRILLELRKAATAATRLIIADFVLPLACADNFGLAKGENERPDEKNYEEYNSACQKASTARDDDSTTANGEVDESMTEGVEGVQVRLAPTPLLANLGKANANAYWMDLTMQVTFNSQERTLREVVALTRSSGWKVVRVTHAAGSLFGHIVAVPVPIPSGDGNNDLRMNEGTALGARQHAVPNNTPQDAGSRCGTPTFGSRMVLPSQDDALLRVHQPWRKLQLNKRV
ncbi:ich1-like protein [Pleurotus pulmonarius]|nr:ich1-like protein [Pleurotus pulmonarius]